MKVAKCFITGENSPVGHQGGNPHGERLADRHHIGAVGKGVCTCVMRPAVFLPSPPPTH